MRWSDSGRIDTKRTHYILGAIYDTKGQWSATSTLQGRNTLTLPHGFAMKLGTISRLMPKLLARNLNRIALSAILTADVYASAVSKTPGPVSVSGSESMLMIC